jgi:hypothetical protein
MIRSIKEYICKEYICKENEQRFKELHRRFKNVVPIRPEDIRVKSYEKKEDGEFYSHGYGPIEGIRSRELEVEGKVIAKTVFNVITGQLNHPEFRIPIDHPDFEHVFSKSTAAALNSIKKHGIAKEAHETLVGEDKYSIYKKYFNAEYKPFGHSDKCSSDEVYIPLDREYKKYSFE